MSFSTASGRPIRT
ncbi:MAG: hypothetical protein DBW80_01640 [Bacteroidetes bacterium]|nr:MAG: hypothetical protein DBW80_01640 [Bacteroidota bacterium]HCE85861.1 hypothetical protein [Bacteroidota bacterium]